MSPCAVEVPKRMQVKRVYEDNNLGLRLDDGARLAAQIERTALERDSPEEQKRREEEAQERKQHVAKQLSGDFMDGWESFANWKALRKVEPSKNWFMQIYRAIIVYVQ